MSVTPECLWRERWTQENGELGPNIEALSRGKEEFDLFGVPSLEEKGTLFESLLCARSFVSIFSGFSVSYSRTWDSPGTTQMELGMPGGRALSLSLFSLLSSLCLLVSLL